MTTPIPKPRLYRDPAMSIANGASSGIIDIGKIDLFYCLPSGGDLEAVFFRGNTGTNVYEETSDPLTLVSGQAIALDQGELAQWSAVMLRNNSGGTVTADLLMNCRG